jgi:hypothetical protein
VLVVASMVVWLWKIYSIHDFDGDIRFHETGRADGWWNELMNQQICSEFYRRLAMLKIWGPKKFGGLVPSLHLHWVLYGPGLAYNHCSIDFCRPRPGKCCAKPTTFSYGPRSVSVTSFSNFFTFNFLWFYENK